MVEKEEFDRAWDRRLDQERRRESSRTAVNRSAVILIGLGLVLAALGAEGQAIYNACFANPVCYPTATGDGWEGFFALAAGGLLVVEVGGILLVCRVRPFTISPRQTR